jgi:hypothetical protein
MFKSIVDITIDGFQVDKLKGMVIKRKNGYTFYVYLTGMLLIKKQDRVIHMEYYTDIRNIKDIINNYL